MIKEQTAITEAPPCASQRCGKLISHLDLVLTAPNAVQGGNRVSGKEIAQYIAIDAFLSMDCPNSQTLVDPESMLYLIGVEAICGSHASD